MKSNHFNLILKDEIKNEYIVTSIAADFEWENGKKTDRLKGWKLNTLNPSAQYEATVIKIETEKAPLDVDEVNKNPVMVAFINLHFSSYFSSATNKQVYVGKADGLKIIKPNT